jgi:riboflavin kinase/FMN adenylyltransferase
MSGMHVLASEIDELSLPTDLDRRESILTIGSFDGIHIGHQALVRRMVEKARQQDKLAGLVTFYPHPSTVLRPDRPTLYLTTPGEKMALLEPMGLDWIAVLSFTSELASMAPRRFVTYLVDRVNMRSVWVGPDFALGRRRAGDTDTLRCLGDELGFEVHDIPYVTQGGEKVSSTQIRTLLNRGHVAAATRLLGRLYSVSGEVVHGAQRGRCLGYPTANVAVRADCTVPANGIYATYARLGAVRYRSVTNIGVRPTFDRGERSVETYLFGFNGDLYGCDLVVEFVARLRPEKRFADIKDLIAQIDQDVIDAQRVLDASAQGVEGRS